MEPMDKVTVEQRLAAIEAKLDMVLARLDSLAPGGLGVGARANAPQDHIPQDRPQLDPGLVDRTPLDYVERDTGPYSSSFTGPAAGFTASPGVDPILEPVLELVRQGRKIQAIKAYRERTGAGLRQAKDAIDAMALGQYPQTGRW
ncbi:hypothetical protein [Streptacidiphilus anmyonensis]|uniref:hypothetical protein n=1 Tax=Streptacidiphilus anmyonensis TaxID=405782 RepID=UPI0013649162